MKIYFLGIGGIGVSALARYYYLKENEVSGEDLVRSEITDGLVKAGIKVTINPKVPNYKLLITNYSLIVYSPAIPKNNPILTAALKEGIKCQSYPEALGELTKQHYTIAVCGTHGKSTTTSMIGLMLLKAGFDPTVIVGTKLKEFGDSNCRVGKSKYLVIEADEHLGSFLNYWPKIIVLTRIEKDHLDYYKNLNNIKKAFTRFIGHLPLKGYLIANTDDKNINQLLKFKIIKQITNDKSNSNPPAGGPNSKHINIQGYSINDREAKIVKKILKVPGEHNISNALAAYQVGRLLKIPEKKCLNALGEYRGAWRRFEEFNSRVNNCKFQIISDYGHHPTEVEVTLKAAREKYPKKKIWRVFQPHQYQRTYYLFKDFVRVLSKAPVDKLMLIDIYGVIGRENSKILKQVNSEILVKKIKAAVGGNRYLGKDDVLYIKDIKKAERHIRENIHGGEVVVIMGAGDIYDLTRKFAEGPKDEGLPT